MAEERIINFPYIPRDVFNVHLQNIADKNEIGRKIDALDAKFDQESINVLIISKQNLIEQKQI